MKLIHNMTSYLSRLLPATVLGAALFNPHAFASEKSLHIVTVVPVVASMAAELTENTSVESRLLTPNKYTIKRVPGWLKRQSPQDFPSADAIISISSVWPEIDAYPALRSQNIGIIPVDIAQALMPGGEKVVLIPDQGEKPSYFWLNPANSQIMLGILHRDLQTIIGHNNQQETEAQKQQLLHRFTTLNEKLRKSHIALESKLLDSDFTQVAVAKPELIDLASATLLPITDLQTMLKDSEPSLLITHRKPGHKSLSEIPAHIKVWHVDDFSKFSELAYSERWEQLVNSIPSESEL